MLTIKFTLYVEDHPTLQRPQNCSIVLLTTTFSYWHIRRKKILLKQCTLLQVMHQLYFFLSKRRPQTYFKVGPTLILQ